LITFHGQAVRLVNYLGSVPYYLVIIGFVSEYAQVWKKQWHYMLAKALIEQKHSGNGRGPAKAWLFLVAPLSLFSFSLSVHSLGGTSQGP
jgi:hypothetical protein